jgi:hypothetical protein
MAESIFVEVLNSSMTLELPSDDTDCMDFTLLTVAIVFSIGFVTIVSTRSGLAPSYDVNITAYGRFISGKSAVESDVTDITPNAATMSSAIITVTGLLTLNFGMFIYSSKL